MTDRFSQKSQMGLAALMGVGCGHSISWHDDDLGAILEHQLNTPLIFDLIPGARNSQDFERLHLDSVDWTMTTFAELLQHSSPPLHLLRLAKDFAKNADQGADAVLPSGVAMALYYASIIVTLIHHKIRLTTMTDDELREGFHWIEQQRWTGDLLRTLAANALKVLDSLS